MVLLDLSAAFNTVDHSLLIHRLQEIGLGGRALSLLSSFLSGRSQSVQLGNFKSAPFSLPCGVPQGSSLSPRLFNIYVADIASLIRSFNLIPTSYADDTQLVVFTVDKNMNPSLNLHHCMTSISSWMSSHCLKLNSCKTEVIMFGNLFPPWSPAWWTDKLGPPPVLVDKVKNLGVILDNKLSFKSQVSKVVSSSFFKIKTIRKILPFVPISSRTVVVAALVTSKLDYCNGLYTNLQSTLLRKLQAVQNAAARLISDIPRHHSVRSVLRDLHWLPVRSRIKFKILCLAHKALHKDGPKFLEDLFRWYSPSRNLRSANAYLMQPVRIRKSNWGGRGVTYNTIKEWNSLPAYLRAIPQILEFRHNLKTWLFRQG